MVSLATPRLENLERLPRLRADIESELASAGYTISEDSKSQYSDAFDRLSAAVDAFRDREEYFAAFLHENDLRKFIWILDATAAQKASELDDADHHQLLLNPAQIADATTFLCNVDTSVQEAQKALLSHHGSPAPPVKGTYLRSVRTSCRMIRRYANITIDEGAVRRFLFSSSFINTYARLKLSHGMALPLKFPSVASELNVLSLLSLLNFASGYRVPLHQTTGRGAFDSIRAFIFSLYLTSSTGGEGDLLSARGLQSIESGKVAELMGVADKVHVEKPHAQIPGVVVGELGGPVWEVVLLITRVMNETGDVLVKAGYQDLGSFVLEALKEGQKIQKNKPDVESAEAACDAILDQLVRAIPGFQDMTLVDGLPVYCFKKALLTIHALLLRYPNQPDSQVPVPSTVTLPIFSDNVIPSMLIHLGVIDLSTSTPALGLARLFPDAGSEASLQSLLALAPEIAKDQKKGVPKEGPIVTTQQAYILRAAAIDACELIVSVAHNLEDNELQGSDGADLQWLREITLPEVDAWLWAVAKDRPDYRQLERFALRNTVYF